MAGVVLDIVALLGSTAVLLESGDVVVWGAAELIEEKKVGRSKQIARSGENLVVLSADGQGLLIVEMSIDDRLNDKWIELHNMQLPCKVEKVACGGSLIVALRADGGIMLGDFSSGWGVS
eukprot:Hpha_TRINITY_DN30370_c0_g1::TRINITY_DN30370_c0_g1_i1::g.147034::m.147034